MTLLLNMEGLKMSKEDAYQTKVMLESIHHLIYEALQEIAPNESTIVEAYEKATTPTRKNWKYHDGSIKSKVDNRRSQG